MTTTDPNRCPNPAHAIAVRPPAQIVVIDMPPPPPVDRVDRPTRHRLGDPGKQHVVLYAGYRPRRRGLARLLAWGAR